MRCLGFVPTDLRASRRAVLGGLAATVSTVAGGVLMPARARADIPRLAKIRARAEPALRERFAEAGVEYPPRRVLLRAFKHEAEVELWVAGEAQDELVLLETYPVCAASGELGPKRQQGDEQVPEGVYSIHRYNAWSGFHMSLRVDYPNASDAVRGVKLDLGGAIMVHGGCASIGCIAIEDGPIERAFLTALDGRRRGKQQPRIHIFPTRFETGAERLDAFASGHPREAALRTLWGELAEVDAAFVRTQRIPDVAIDPKSGAYSVVPSDVA